MSSSLKSSCAAYAHCGVGVSTSLMFKSCHKSCWCIHMINFKVSSEFSFSRWIWKKPLVSNSAHLPFCEWVKLNIQVTITKTNFFIINQRERWQEFLDKTSLCGFELSINSKMSKSLNHSVVYVWQDGTKWQVVDKPYGRAGPPCTARVVLKSIKLFSWCLAADCIMWSPACRAERVGLEQKREKVYAFQERHKGRHKPWTLRIQVV